MYKRFDTDARGFDIVNVGAGPAIPLSRRAFLKAGIGLTLGIVAPVAWTQGPGRAGSGAAAAPELALQPNAFVRVQPDNTVVVIVKHLEMGQGTYTGLPTLVAEELDADWKQVRVEGAPADPERYNNLDWGKVQGTGGSTAIANSYEQLRKAGATARAMLVAAAAARWNVPPDSLAVSRGVVSHKASGRKATFGELAVDAGKLGVPADVKLKDPKNFVYIGKTTVRRTDSHDKSLGLAMYTQDVKLPEMLVAVVAHAPRFGAKMRSFDATKALASKNVVDVVAIPRGVAVLAKDFWSAKKGRDALSVDWDNSGAMKVGTAELMDEYKKLAKSAGVSARKEGDLERGFSGAAKTIEAGYEFPYLAHAAMEPMNCVVRLDRDKCEIWNGEQLHTIDQSLVSAAVGLKPEQVWINMLYAGGSFGRRANPQSDYVVEAATIAKARAAKGVYGIPVKLVWTREDDMRAGFYRPMYFHRMRGAVDAKGNIVAWQHRIVGQSIMSGTAFEAVMIKEYVDNSSTEGAANLPYAIPNMNVDLHSPKASVPVQWWRSVGSTHNAYSTETFLDELAAAGGKDPYELRRSLLDKHPRHRGVLELVAEKAGWSKPLAKSREAGEKRGRGIALHESFHTYVAQVAEVTVKEDGSFKVDRVVCAVDCGVAVNPDVIRAQMEGGIAYGLSAALHEAVTIKEGAVVQSNFHDYPPLRINEMPRIEVHIVPSNQKPSGVGEPGVPVIAPAVANALYAATGKRVYSLPIKL